MGKHKPRPTSDRRVKKNIEPNTSLLIYCNGETERIYFEDLRDDLRLQSSTVRVISTEYNRLSMVRRVQRLLKEDAYEPNDKYEVWLVFDVDAMSDGNQTSSAIIKSQADEAVKLCRRLKYHPIVSNEAFELWFLLHFGYIDAHLHRAQLFEKIKKQIPTYKKAISIYEKHLKDKTDQAIQNGKKLCKTYNDEDCSCPSNYTPYTNVHKLVSRMRQLTVCEKN